MNDVVIEAPKPNSSFDFDGHRFATWQRIGPGEVAMLDLAYRARRGDGAAAELLNAFKVTIVDADEKRYWPMS